MKLNLAGLFLLFAISMAFSQEAPEPIKFQITEHTDTSQLLKLDIPTQNPPLNQPLNLSALTAKDSENFEVYSKRYALIEDSVSAIHKSIEEVKKKAATELPPLAPKDEFEKQAQYDIRVQKYNAEIAALTEKDTKALNARLAELEKAKVKIRENQAALGEKNIFSQENEIDFIKILRKDTTVLGYEARIKKINERQAEVDKEIEGMRQFVGLQKKYEDYSKKLNSSIAVLNDYIIAAQSSLLSETALTAKIELIAIFGI